MSQVQLFSSPACQSQLYAIDVKAISELAKDALELPPRQRMTLARILLELSEDDQEFSPQVEAAWEDEICRRMKAVETGAATTRSLEEVFAELDRRLPS